MFLLVCLLLIEKLCSILSIVGNNLLYKNTLFYLSY
uniref:Uncharacterized protein n=1 Tax=Staphylococcus phage 184DA TaxID=3110532 RepID=A0AAU6MX48_9CAUD